MTVDAGGRLTPVTDAATEPTEALAADVAIRRPTLLDPGARVDAAAALLARDHVRLALVVDASGRLLTTIETADLAGLDPASPAVRAGALTGRVVPPGLPVSAVLDQMERNRTRRLAVVDEDGRLLGLVCRKASGRGFCTDEGVLAGRRARRRG